MKKETNTYEVKESFSHIYVNGTECDIRLLPSQDGRCQVVCTEGDKVTHTVMVTEDTLRIVRTDHRRWYERIGVFFWIDMAIDVYLPESQYESLYLKTVSGDITVPDSFAFAGAELYTVSGEVVYAAATEGGLSAKTTSGDLKLSNLRSGECDVRTTSGEVRLEDVRADSLSVATTSGDVTIRSAQAEDDVTVKTTSGEIRLEQGSARNVTICSTSGDVKLESVTARAHIEIKTVSGAIQLPDSDAQTLTLHTTSGDVTASLRSGKEFVTRTTSGEVRVPDPSSGGKCEVTTISGDIKIKIGGA